MSEHIKEAFFKIAIGGTSVEDKLNQETFYRRMILAGFTIDDTGQVTFGTVPPVITNINANNITSGTLPLARLVGITNTEISASAAIAQSKLALSITNAEVNASAAISWSKISKTGSSLADLTTRSAGDLSSGNLPYAQMPTGSGTWTAAPTISGATVFSSTVTHADDIVFSANKTIRQNTSDGSDSGQIGIVGGGAGGVTRGAGAFFYGNENGTSPGSIDCIIGNVANSFFRVQDANSTVAFKITGASGLATFGAGVALKFITGTGDADQNNYAPTGWSAAAGASIITISTITANRTMTGLAAGVDGSIVIFVNYSSFSWLFPNESASSTDVNRFRTANSTTITLRTNGTLMGVYAGSRWNLFSV